ncbi:MAG: bifunctional DNA-formamidopyrimidine glycosylase/DNA-(apurinic or apyrimidinic site) lyase [Acidimicrobiales bacterium]
MPELPEVETIRRDLEKLALGKRVKAVEVIGARSVRRHRDPGDFVSRLEGHKITSVSRRGKYIVVGLDGDDVLVIHLGMSGQILRAKGPKEAMAKHTHVCITFTQGGQVRFIDPRTFGEMFVAGAAGLEESIPELAHLGFDPVDDVMSWTTFGEKLLARRAKLKTLLMDQRFVAGIGNIYADEVLFAAGLRYDRSSETLSSQEIRRLYRSMVETLQDAIKHRGSSLGDEQYRDLAGSLGSYQKEHKVYNQEGKACRRCRSKVVRVKTNGRSTYLCPQCQV